MTPIAPKDIFKLSNIHQDGRNKLQGRPIDIAWECIRLGMIALQQRHVRACQLWRIIPVLDD